MDGSDLPCYILWPVQSPEQSWCIDAWKGDWVRLDRCNHMAPLGIEHFFDVFYFEAKRLWRTAACQALHIPSCRIAEDTHLEQLNETTFSLSPRRIPVERKTSTVKRDLDLDMESCQNHISDEDSGWSGVSDDSSTDSECTDVEVSSIVSDLEDLTLPMTLFAA